MATNAKKDKESTVVDDDVTVSEDAVADLKKAKADVETSQEADEPAKSQETEDKSEETGDQEGQTDEVATEESEEGDETPPVEEPSFVKEFPGIAGDTEAEYLKNLELAYKNSTTEALRLKGLAEGKDEETEDTDSIDPRLAYVERIVNKDMIKAYEKFRKEFPQVDDPEQLKKFSAEVADISTFYLDKKGIQLTAEEIYPRAAANLGWETANKVGDDDKLAVALKDKAAAGKTVSATKPITKSKVTDEMIAINRIMYPDKTDTEIREELEPHVK